LNALEPPVRFTTLILSFTFADNGLCVVVSSCLERKAHVSPTICVTVFPSKSALPKALPLEERVAVLDGDITLKGVADFIRHGRAKNIVVICGT
jgi:hypothetical protein